MVIPEIIIARAGPFRRARRGRFDETSLEQIVDCMLAHRDGCPCYWDHGTYPVGRFAKPRVDPAEQAVVADLNAESGWAADVLYDAALHDPHKYGCSLRCQRESSRIASTGGVAAAWRLSAVTSVDIVGRGQAEASGDCLLTLFGQRIGLAVLRDELAARYSRRPAPAPSYPRYGASIGDDDRQSREFLEREEADIRAGLKRVEPARGKLCAVCSFL